ncbi:MAG: hypothetical protein MUO85_03615 [candidate division Zixibacteria bacterium]|nr:hypothetical protein [candidate division Zixibacteria bacterium]
MKYKAEVKKKARCAKCGKRLKKGGLKYNIRVEVASDFDGYLEDYSKKPLDFLENRLKILEEDLKNRSEKELEEDVYIERSFLVCEGCRDQFVKILREFEKEE